MSSYDYYQINMANALEVPSTVHCKDTNLVRYYAKYLLQKVLSVYKWTLPETWDYDYFQYIIATQGYIAVFDTPEFDEDEWETRSKTVRNLIEACLEKKAKNRITIDQFINHAWFKKNMKQKYSI